MKDKILLTVTIIVFIIIGFILTPKKAHAWYYSYMDNELSDNDASKFEDQLTDDFKALPKCIQKVVNKRLKKVAVRRGFEEYPINAESYRFGFTVIEVRDENIWSELLHHYFKFHRPIDNEFVHEVGHQYDWEQGDISRLPEFQNAVKRDFKLMTPEESDHNKYLQNPSEAWAELFAVKFNGVDYFEQDGHFNPELFPNSRTLLNSYLCKDK